MASPSNSDDLGQPIPPAEGLAVEPSRVVRRDELRIPRPARLPAEAASFLKQKRPPLSEARANSRPETVAANPAAAVAPRKAADFGNFAVLGRVAGSADADLFLAELAGPERTPSRVALKVLSPSPTRTPSERRELLHEAVRASHLAHPNLPRTLEAGAVGGAVYLAVEWVEGQSLPELIAALSQQGEGLTPAMIAHLIAQAAHALDGAHRTRDPRNALLDIVHRRIHPGEIMIGFDGSIKLLGFGMPAPAAPDDQGDDPAQRSKLGYRAPEQLRDGTSDARSDIFALGVCLYELLTGSRLHKRATVRGTVSAVLTERPASIRASLPELPELLDVIVLRALEKRPEHRFQRAAEMAAALEAYLLSQPESVNQRRLGRLMVRLFPEQAQREPKLECEPAALSALTSAEVASVRPGRPDAEERLGGVAAFGLGLLTLALVALTALGVLGLGR